ACSTSKRKEKFKSHHMTSLKTHWKYAPNSLFLGGRSMGARSAVAVCKRICDRQKDAVQGVLSEPWPACTVPNVWSVLFVSGTADNMCEQNLLQSIMHVMKSTSAVHWVKDANHGLTVRGRTEESVLEEVSC
uniref:KANL3/Tex30 alpha/beta hydrolase-like domain-containing protein n=1 Tax=Sinocyclocheilus grahami TaxID=75366 RepID=A0A672KVS0_SINGR